MKLLSMSLALAAVSSPVLATTWETSIQRGFETFTAEGEGGSVTLVCDPDRVRNPDVSHASFIVNLLEDPRASRIVFLGQSGHQAYFEVREGVATQNDAEPEQWRKLIDLVEGGGQLAVVTSRASMILTMDPPENFRCL